MRITIDIDDQDATATVSPSVPTDDATTAGALDGGAFGGDASASASESSPEDAIDAAGPPEWLVAEIAAEVASGAAESVGAEDAGPGPT